MIDWIERLRRLPADGPVAMIGILATEGSAPRGAGTRMLVTTDAAEGTIGGGQLEYRAVEQARAILSCSPGEWRIQDYPLGPLLGQCCGGRVRLLVEHVDPAALAWTRDAADGAVLATTLRAGGVERRVAGDAAALPMAARGARPGEGSCWTEVIGQRRRPLYLFGAGHVGQAIARHAANLPLRLCWFDTRDAFAATDAVTVVPPEGIARCIDDAPGDAAILVMTHDHGLDYALTHAALARAPVAFVGLIGSATKRARFLSRLGSDGIGPMARDRLTCPIGIAGIDGKEPDVIAIAALAQVLRLDDPAR